jgi:hypothetical protein
MSIGPSAASIRRLMTAGSAQIERVPVGGAVVGGDAPPVHPVAVQGAPGHRVGTGVPWGYRTGADRPQRGGLPVKKEGSGEGAERASRPGGPRWSSSRPLGVAGGTPRAKDQVRRPQRAVAGPSGPAGRCQGAIGYLL